MTRTVTAAAFSMPLVIAAVLTTGSAVHAASVTPDVIFGTGVDNGSFTIDSQKGVELGLRAKLRFNQAGQPENTFNWDGNDTYTFNPGVAPGQSFPVAEWSFEWSINTAADGAGRNLDGLTYALSLTGPAGSGGFSAFDPINDVNPHPDVNQVQWDHAIGDNSTGPGGGTVIPNSADDEAGYLDLIANNNVAQNSWQPHWFVAGFDPTVPGDYLFTLTAFDERGPRASTSMTVTVVPLPAAAWAGLALLGMMGGVAGLRRKLRQRGFDD